MATKSWTNTQVAAGIIRNEGKILICRRPVGEYFGGKWEFPGGKVEPGETYEEALFREIREELGIDVKVGPLRWKTRYAYPDRIVCLYFYECSLLDSGRKVNRVATYEWVLPADLGRFDFLPADEPLIEMLTGNSITEGAKFLQSNLEDSYRACAQIAASHYENFPVASRFLPKRMRRYVGAVYAFARCADDFVDLPGAGTEDERLARLDDWERRLEAAGDGRGEGVVFSALADAIHVLDLPLQPFRDLIAAFRQDATVSRYMEYSGLLDYCRLSANPVGRIMLMLHGVRDVEAFRASDAICSALQIANHLQDVKEDYLRGRVYLPQTDLMAFGVKEEEMGGNSAGAEFRALMVYQIRLTRELFAEGHPLLRRIGGAFGRELRAIFRGGLAALESIERVNYDVLKGSPRPTFGDKIACFAAAFLPPGRIERRICPGVNARADWNYCRWYVRASRSSFSLAFIFLSSARRRALFAIYGYCRAVDDIADNPGDLAEKRRRLDDWADSVVHLKEYSHRHPILRELKSAVLAYGVSISDLLDVCKGVGMDLEQNRYQNFEELSVYCDKVASAVGFACLKVFGENSKSGLEYGRTLGRALQLTNILRDFWVDISENRIYLPLDDLRRFGVSEETILRRERTEALSSLLWFEGERARELFQKADELLPKNSHWCLFPVRLMGRVYRKILENMMAANFPELGSRYSLSRWAKVREVFLCLLGW